MSASIEMPAALFVDPRVQALPLAAQAVLIRLHFVAAQCSRSNHVAFPRGAAFDPAVQRTLSDEGVEHLGALLDAGLVLRDPHGLRLLLVPSSSPLPPRTSPDPKPASATASMPPRPADRVSARARRPRHEAPDRRVSKKLAALFSKYGLDTPEARAQWFKSPQGLRTVERLALTHEQVKKASNSAGRRAGQFGSESAPNVRKISGRLAPQAEDSSLVEVGTETTGRLAPSTEPTTPAEPTSRAVSETSFFEEISNQSAAAARATVGVPNANLGANHHTANDSLERGATADRTPRIIDALCHRLGPHELLRNGGSTVERRIEKCLLEAIERDPRLGEKAGIDALAEAIRDRSGTWPTWHAVKSGRLRMSLTLLAGEPGPDNEPPCTVLLEAVAAACAGFDDARREPKPAKRIAVEASRPGPRATGDDARKLNPFTRTVA